MAFWVIFFIFDWFVFVILFEMLFDRDEKAILYLGLVQSRSIQYVSQHLIISTFENLYEQKFLIRTVHVSFKVM